MYRLSALSAALFALLIGLSAFGAQLAYAQTATDTQLRATIYAEIMADPRSQTMTQAQINALADSLTAGAEAQGITASQLTNRPSVTEPSNLPAAPSECSGFVCALQHAFGLDGSIPIIPIAFFVIAGLFILIYGIMREMGHPHTQA